jgi:serine/threonine-protein kinase
MAWSGPAVAQQRAAAEKLFSEAAELMDAGEFEAACPKLEESQRLDPAGGTVLLLAHCYENSGRTASAWEQFKSAISWAQRDGRPEREELAREHADNLEAKLSRLALDVPPDVEKLPGLQISVDGAEFGRALWSTPLPLDPGPHVVTATADGHTQVQLDVSLGKNGDLKVVTIPMLERGGGAAAAPTPVAETPATQSPEADRPAAAPGDSGDTQRLVAYVVGGVGIVSVGGGALFGIMALNKRSDAEKLCPTSPCAEAAAGVEANDTAYTFANLSNVGIGVGVVALGVATYLLLTAPDKPQTARFDPGFRVDPLVSKQGGGLSVGGTF